MFLIVAKWKDNSDSIFLVGNDPNNKKIPDWVDVFRKLDTVADPADASIQFAKVSREFLLLRDEDTLEFSLDDAITCSSLEPLQLTKNLHHQWYDILRQSGERAANESVDEEEDTGF